MNARQIAGHDVTNALGYTPLRTLDGEDSSKSLVTTGGITQTLALALSAVKNQAIAATTAAANAASQAEVDALQAASEANAAAAQAAHDLAAIAKSEADLSASATSVTALAEEVADLMTEMASKADLENGVLAAAQANLTASDGVNSVTGAVSLTFAGGATVSGSNGHAVITLPSGGGPVHGVRPGLATPGMSWLAQGASTAEDIENGPLVLRLATSSNTQIRGMVWPLTQGGPFTIRAHLKCLAPADNYFGQGIVLASDASPNAKLSTFAETYGNRPLMQHQYYQDPADIYSTTKTIGWNNNGELFHAVVDNGTNLIWCVSPDGEVDTYSVFRVTPRDEYFIAGAFGIGGSCCDSPASGPTTGMPNIISVLMLVSEPGITINIS